MLSPPVKPTEFSLGEARQGRAFVRQGRLSRHKVSVGEPADGSPPKNFEEIFSERKFILKLIKIKFEIKVT